MRIPREQKPNAATITNLTQDDLGLLINGLFELSAAWSRKGEVARAVEVYKLEQQLRLLRSQTAGA